MESGAGKYDWPLCALFFHATFERNPNLKGHFLFGTESNLKMLLMILIHEYS